MSGRRDLYTGEVLELPDDLPMLVVRPGRPGEEEGDLSVFLQSSNDGDDNEPEEEEETTEEE